MAPHPPSDPAVALNLALALVASSIPPLLLLDKDLSVRAASTSFCSAFQIEPSTTDGCLLATLGSGEWNVPQLSSLLKATAFGLAQVANYEMELVREGQEPRCLVLNAKKLTYAEQSDTFLILSITDITDARIAEKLMGCLLREKDILLHELHHRVANSLQIIAGVLMQSARNVQSDETRIHLKDAHQRVMSVAAFQPHLAASRQGDVELRPYFAALCESIAASMIPDHNKLSLEVTTDESITTADASVSLGLIVTELVISALKHAFPGNQNNRILVDYRSRGPHWTLSVSDDGVDMPETPKDITAGLGSNIINALAKQLGARIDISSENPGTAVSVVHTFVPVLVGQVAAETARAV